MNFRLSGDGVRYALLAIAASVDSLEWETDAGQPGVRWVCRGRVENTQALKELVDALRYVAAEEARKGGDLISRAGNE